MSDEGQMRDELAPEDDDMGIDGMPEPQDDGTLRDVIAELSVLPPVSESDVQRIVSRARTDAAALERRSGPRWAAARRSPEVSRSGARRGMPARWLRPVPLAAAATLVLAAGIGGFAVGARGRPAEGNPPSTVRAVAAAADRPAGAFTAVAADARAEAPIATQFVLEASQAQRVALVGAFNGWDADATPLTRDPATGLWTVTLPLAPGRHVYAFMVDGSVLTLDPRAPKSVDPDLGASGSVILVGRP